MIRLTGLRKNFGKLEVLKGIDLEVENGEVLALLGPSGSGKSTLLRCINYLEHPTGGTIELGDLRVDAVAASKADIRALRASTAMVFQQYNLFKNRTALENVTIGLTAVRGIEKRRAREIAEHYLSKVGMSHKLDSYPRRLSGGEQQRVAIARALALGPQFLLLDEPTSALDRELVAEVLETIRAVAEEGNAMILVTHELGFAREVAHRVVLMDKGVVVEEGPTAEIFTNPKEERTVKFLGSFVRPFVYAI
jgi:L-cystine transport system ATP-binding protein